MTADPTLRPLVEALVGRAGIPADRAEVDALVAGAPGIAEAVRRLYELPIDHETEPAVELRVV